MKEKLVLAPQKGPQEMFLASSADICIYGGAAGGGKTYALLLEAIRHMNNSDFNALIFRKEYTQITSPGGLWDSSRHIYSWIQGAQPVKTPKLHWCFRSGATVSFAHLGRDEDCEGWQGAQIALIGFDELTHFSEWQFFYMLSRNRTISGVKPYVRATCNPDADSWVATFIEWWIDQDTGYPIKERSGKIRWMIRINEVIHWVDSKEAAIQLAMENDIARQEAETMPKSVTFIASTLQDNKILMKMDPGYLANLKALPLVERERLLYGNWKIKAAAGLMFKRTQVNIVSEIPNDVILWCRGWDLAATSEDEKGNPAYTAGVLIGKRSCGRYIVADVINRRLSASDVRKLVLMTAQADRAAYGRVVQRLPQDPGQAGKEQAQSYMKLLSGFVVKIMPESGDKVTRAEPFSAMWQGTETMDTGFVDILIAPWNSEFFNQYESFPQSDFKDMVDAGANAFNQIESGMTYSVPPSGSSLGKDSYWRK